MNYYLIFHLDKNGNDGIVLKHTEDLFEMDQFIGLNFKDRNDVIVMFNTDIGEFCLNRMDSIKRENLKNNRDRLGAVSLFCRYQNNYGIFTYKIPIIYQNDNKLPDYNTCLRRIKESLEDDNNLKKLIEEKSYLLSKYEYNSIIKYFNSKDVKLKREVIYHFVNRIKDMSDVKKYFFFRSLMNVCNLSKIVTSEPLKEKLESYSDDHHFTSLIESENYDELHKYYDLDRIYRDSNINRKK